MAHMGAVVCGAVLWGGGRSFACSDQRPGTDVGERRRETSKQASKRDSETLSGVAPQTPSIAA
jgi:hypothetical protein